MNLRRFSFRFQRVKGFLPQLGPSAPARLRPWSQPIFRLRQINFPNSRLREAASVNKIFFSNLFLAGLAAALAGCNPAPRDDAAKGRQAGQDHAAIRPAALQSKITFSEFPAGPKPDVTPELLARGKELYVQNCAACHGAKGDAKSDAAAFLLPKPRNFQTANFRLRSTPTSNLPTDLDLFRAISLGMPGTPMPPWHYLVGEADRWALVEFIKTFSPRFADANEDRRTVVSLGNPPPRNEKSLAEGKALYTKLSCNACHGEEGRVDGPNVAQLVDDSGTHINPRDFSKPSAFKSGYATKEIARTILTGFNGTPMVGFYGTIPPEDAWKVAYYVETFAKASPTVLARSSQNFLEREELGAPDVKIQLRERAWQYDPSVIHVRKGQVVEITFEPTDNGLGVGHGFSISSYDEAVFLNGAMVGAPKTVKFRADRAGKFTYYCATQCSTDKLHPLMNGTLYVDEVDAPKTASLNR